MTKFKDVAHLYLGVICQNIDGSTYELKPSHFPSNWRTAECKHKPILRRLSSLTDEEKAALDGILNNPQATSVHPYLQTSFWFTYLLSLHIDIFGLIDSGEAIEKTN